MASADPRAPRSTRYTQRIIRRKTRLASLTICFSIHRPLRIRRESKSSPQSVYDTVKLDGCATGARTAYRINIGAQITGTPNEALDGRQVVKG